MNLGIDEFAGSPVSGLFVYEMNYGIRLSYNLETEKGLSIFHVRLWYVMKPAIQKSKNDRPRMKYVVWALTQIQHHWRIPTAINSTNVYFMKYHVPNPRIPIFLLQKQIAIDKHICPNEIPCMVSPAIRPINWNVSDHFLVQIIHTDDVKIVAGRLLCRITSSTSHFRQPFHDVNPPSICEVVGHACT